MIPTLLVLVFISPETAENQELRQCLSYFFPVYAYSSQANQRRMKDVRNASIESGPVSDSVDMWADLHPDV